MAGPLPLRLHRDGLAGHLGRLLEAAAPEDWSAAERERIFAAMQRRDRLRRRRGRIAVGCLGAAALAAFAALGSRSMPGRFDVPAGACPVAARPAEAARAPSAPRPAVVVPGEAPPVWSVMVNREIGTVEFSDDGAVEMRQLPSERQILVNGGMLRAQVMHQDPEKPVVVVTPHLRVVVIGTRFDVRVEPNATVVSVLEGRVRAESGARAVFVSGGESIDSADPRLIAPAAQTAAAPPHPVPAARASAARRTVPSPASPVVAPGPSAPECGALETVEARLRCYGELAAGETLRAQSALFTLGMVARDQAAKPQEAIARWSEYAERFPNGALAPEAALGIFEAYLGQAKRAEAIAAAESFERRFERDPRVVEVALARAELLCAEPERKEEAFLLLQRLLARYPAERDAVADVRARCPQRAADP